MTCVIPQYVHELHKRFAKAYMALPSSGLATACDLFACGGMDESSICLHVEEYTSVGVSKCVSL